MAEVASRTEPSPGPYSVLIHNPTYRWFYAGQGASLIGTWSQAAAARWIVFQITDSERAVGIVDAIEILPGVVVGSLVAGISAHPIGVAPILVGSGLLRVLVGTVVFLTGSLIPTPQEKRDGVV